MSNHIMFAFALFSMTAACGDGEPTSSAGQELSGEQCSYFASQGTVGICHYTGAARKPYTILSVPLAACLQHVHHDSDYVAVGDPTCNGQGCLPAGAPVDGTVECCAGLVPTGGVCAPGLYSTAASYTVPPNAAGVIIEDFDHDAVLDVVVSSSAGLSLLRGHGGGVLEPAVTFDGGEHGHDALAAADLNGDGLVDLINSGQGNEPLVTINLNLGAGMFSAPLGIPSAAGMVGGVATGDLDGDGHADVITSNFLGGSISVFHGNGDGTITLAGTYGNTPYAGALRLADLDHDGHLDVAVSSNGSGITILRGNGDGSLTRIGDYYLGVPGDIAIADLDRDGQLDLAATNCCGGDGVSILRGTGAGDFLPPVTFPVGVNLRAVAIADLDLDGNLDLAITDNNNDEPGPNVAYLRGDGTGAFGAATFMTAGRSPAGLAIGDLDGDGHPDLAVTANQDFDFGLSIFLDNR